MAIFALWTEPTAAILRKFGGALSGARTKVWYSGHARADQSGPTAIRLLSTTNPSAKVPACSPHATRETDSEALAAGDHHERVPSPLMKTASSGTRSRFVMTKDAVMPYETAEAEIARLEEIVRE